MTQHTTLPSKTTQKKLNRRNAEDALLAELALDFDWDKARKRAGISKGAFAEIYRKKDFQDRAANMMDKVSASKVDLHGAVKKFNRTQEILAEALEGGDLSVANSLIKSHEIEFRMNGLFEKDNKQKGSQVMINISLDAPAKSVMLDAGDIENASQEQGL